MPFTLWQRVEPEIMVDFYGVVEKPSNKCSLMLRLSKDEMPQRSQLPIAEGLQVLPVAIKDGEDVINALMLRLENIKYKDVFTVLANDIIQTTLEQPSNNPVKVFLERIRQWQKCLSIQGASGLNKEEQKGLYGELFFLRELLKQGFAGKKSVNAWVGPSSAVNDFQFDNCSVEVKTSSSKRIQELSINGALQLDERHSPNLYLFHLSVDLTQTIGETLNEIVASVRELYSKIDGKNPDDFNVKLNMAGYLDAQADKYSEVKYRFRDGKTYKVHGDFPRIREGEYRPGVGSIQYYICISGCEEYKIPTENIINIILGES
jgi:hypothetical protein